ncbi:MAG TPA: rhodanese-like domain-containing protein [Thermoanaerobaculia bacterium]|nr:rhodanese-like domain-containing protein [Thermoanaerobaculia bacterium]
MPRNERPTLSEIGWHVTVGALAVFLTSCAASRGVVAALTANCREIEVGVAHEMMRDNPGVLLLDVRRREDFTVDLPHLMKAREIPLPDLPRRYREIAAWKREPILVFSRDGTEAASACEFLAHQEFPYVSHVAGGIEAWMRGGYGRSSQSQ